jgi:hypothetical protein
MLKEVCNRAYDWLVVTALLFVTLVVPSILDKI